MSAPDGLRRKERKSEREERDDHVSRHQDHGVEDLRQKQHFPRNGEQKRDIPGVAEHPHIVTEDEQNGEQRDRQHQSDQTDHVHRHQPHLNERGLDPVAGVTDHPERERDRRGQDQKRDQVPLDRQKIVFQKFP